jgi:hypothetical protein
MSFQVLSLIEAFRLMRKETEVETGKNRKKTGHFVVRSEGFRRKGSMECENE